MESGELGAGYDPVEREWELIVKYSGEAELIRQTAVSVTKLLGGYAVIVIKESRIEELAALDGVEFIEKPKNLYFQVENGRRVSVSRSAEPCRRAERQGSPGGNRGQRDRLRESGFQK